MRLDPASGIPTEPKVQGIRWPSEDDFVQPVPSLAAKIIDSVRPNEFGWFFPSANDPAGL